MNGTRNKENLNQQIDFIDSEKVVNGINIAHPLLAGFSLERTSERNKPVHTLLNLANYHVPHSSR